MTVTTIYSDTSDGYANAGPSVSFAALRAVATAGFSISVGDTTRVGIYISSSNYWGYQSFLSFDTSVIPDLDPITGVLLSIWGTVLGAQYSGQVQQARAAGWDGSISTDDWFTGTEFAALPLLATQPSANFTVGSYSDFTSEAAFPANINVTGATTIVLCTEVYATGSSPGSGTSANWDIRFLSADWAGTTQDPKLTITHGASFLPRLTLMGVG